MRIANFILISFNIGFILALVWFGFLYLALEGEMRADFFQIAVLRSMMLSFAVGLVVGGFLSFYWHNIRIEIGEDAIAFFRGKREYVYLPFESFIFVSHVHTDHIEGMVALTTTRYIRAFLRHGGRGTDYRCHNFCKETFSSFIAHAKAASIAYEQATGRLAPLQESKNWVTAADADATYHGGVFRFEINQRDLGWFHKRLFKWMFIPFAIISVLVLLTTPLDMIWISIWFSVSLLALPTLMGGIPLLRLARRSPKKIELHQDMLVFDNDNFYFSDITQLKVTAPLYGAGALFPRFRRVTIDAGGYKSMYILGDSLDAMPGVVNGKRMPKAFPEYEVLFMALSQMFQDRPEFFVVEHE